MNFMDVMFALSATSRGIAPSKDDQAGTSNLFSDASESEQPTNQQVQPIAGVIPELAFLMPEVVLHEYLSLLLQEASMDGHGSETVLWGSTPNSITGNPRVMDALTGLMAQNRESVPPGDVRTGRLNLPQGQLMHIDGLRNIILPTQANTVTTAAGFVSTVDTPELAELKIQLSDAAMQIQPPDGKPQAQPGLWTAITSGGEGKTEAQYVFQAYMTVDAKGPRGGDSVLNNVSAGQPATIVNGSGKTVRGALQAEGLQPALVAENQATAGRFPGVESAPTTRSTELPPHLQLAEAIRGQIGRDGQGSTHVRLQLQPESLGEVVIRLVYKEGNLSTHFHAATEGARQIIESSLGQLRESLATHQLNLQHTTVSAGGEEGRWGQDWNHSRNFNRPNHHTPADERPEAETVFEQTDEVKQPGNLQRLNYFV